MVALRSVREGRFAAVNFGARRMAAVAQCANACSLRTRVTTPGSVSGRDGVQSWSPRGFRKAGGEQAQGRGRVVSMALAEVEGCDSSRGILGSAQRTVVAVALGLSLSLGGKLEEFLL